MTPFSLPLSYLAGPLLLQFGTPEELTSYVQQFVWIRLAGVPGIVLISDVSTFLNSQRCVRLPMLVNAAGSLAQALLVVGLTRAFGFIGAPWAMSLVELSQVRGWRRSLLDLARLGSHLA